MLFSRCFFLFFNFYAVYLFRMTNLGEIVDIGQGMCFFNNSIQTLAMFDTGSAYQALAVIDIAKDDSIRRAGLLAGRLNVYHIHDRPVVLFGFQLAFLQTLCAERTFFHHTTATNNYIRVQHHTGQVVVHLEDHRIQFTYRRLVLVVREAVGAGVISPVKAAYFIRTVVGAIAGPDTAVVSHLVQTFGAVVGSVDRANVLTGSIVAMLTQHGLEDNLDVVRIIQLTAGSGVVAVNTQPVHIVEAQYFTLADHRYIVLCMTGYHAGAATDAGIHVDGHTPLEAGFVIDGIECTLFFKVFDTAKRFQFLFTLFPDNTGILFKFIQGHLLHHFRTTLIAVVRLSLSDFIFLFRVFKARVGAKPVYCRTVKAEQREGILANPSGSSAHILSRILCISALTAITDSDTDHFIMRTRNDHRR